MDLFTIVVQPGDIEMFKGTRSPYDVAREDPIWVGMSADTANKYGPRVTQLTFARPLRLINITSWLFQHHFMDQLNLRGIVLRDKDLAVLPLGIPNTYIANPPRVTANPLVAHEAAYYMGHRMSEGAIDKHMVKHLITIYGDTHDGYIQKVPMSSAWMDTFSPEVCLFKPDRCGLTVVNVRNSRMPAGGGGGGGRGRGGGRRPRAKKQHGGTAGAAQPPRRWCNIPEEGKITLNMSGPDDRNDPVGDFVSEYNEWVKAGLLHDGYAEAELRYDTGGRIVSPPISERIGRSIAWGSVRGRR